MFGRRKKECAELSEKYGELEAVVGKLETTVGKLVEKVDELGKRTISQRTQEEEAPVSLNQIFDEWLNGENKGKGEKDGGA